MTKKEKCNIFIAVVWSILPKWPSDVGVTLFSCLSDNRDLTRNFNFFFLQIIYLKHYFFFFCENSILTLISFYHFYLDV